MKMIEEATPEEFLNSGLLFLVNTLLHVFGWVLVVEEQTEEKPARVFPARTAFRGFSSDTQDKNFKRLQKTFGLPDPEQFNKEPDSSKN